MREIAFDKAYAQPVMGPLTDDGFPVVTMQQGWVTQSPALNELERAIVSRKLRHGGHPVLKWCFENVAIHTDSAGNRVMHKGKSRDRIDGAVACWMAVSRAAAGDSSAGVYAEERPGRKGFSSSKYVDEQPHRPCQGDQFEGYCDAFKQRVWFRFLWR